MLRTKYALTFFIILSVALGAFALYLLLFAGGTPSAEDTAKRQPVFVENSEVYRVAPEEQPTNKEAVREALIQKLSDYERVQTDTETQKREAERDALSPDEGPLAGSDTLPTSTPATSSIPTMSVTAGGWTQQGTRGSYCWNGVCEARLISTISVNSQPVSASGTLSYSVAAEAVPEQVFIFFRKQNGTSTAFERELTESEKAQSAFPVPVLRGDYLMSLTGVWGPNREVSNVFGVRIE